MDELPKRKRNRLDHYDYSQNGAYFITICTQNRQERLCTIRRDDTDTPSVKLSKYGNIVQKNIELIETYYKYTSVDKYIIMPDHIHIIIVLSNPANNEPGSFIYVPQIKKNGTPGSSVSTPKRSDGTPGSSCPTGIPAIITALKKFTTKEMSENIWQTSYHDHIIRDEEDHLRLHQYMNENPIKWIENKCASEH